MNRERLTILRDHLVSLPDWQVNMSSIRRETECGTVACISGWATTLWPEARSGGAALGMIKPDGSEYAGWCELIMPPGWTDENRYTRADAIAAIQSLIDNPDDDALPVWPEKAA